MPELIALLHILRSAWPRARRVGRADLHPSRWAYRGLDGSPVAAPDPPRRGAFIGIFIGAVTFTGSIVAYLKLQAKIKSAPLILPGKNPQPGHRWLPSWWLTAVLLRRAPALPLVDDRWSRAVGCSFSGWHLVASIGGGGRPDRDLVAEQRSLGLDRGRERAILLQEQRCCWWPARWSARPVTTCSPTLMCPGDGPLGDQHAVRCTQRRARHLGRRTPTSDRFR